MKIKKNNEMVLKIFVFVILLLVFLLIIPLGEAHMVCGEVNDSDEGMNADWFDVWGYYDHNKTDNKTSCKISPSENKYCCDFMGDKGWKIGDVVGLEIFEKDLGYFAGPVSVKTTGEGYDIAPEMKLKKAINIDSLHTKVVFPEENNQSNNTNSFLFNAGFEFPYNNFSIYLNHEKVLNGTENKTSKYFNVTTGRNILIVNVSNIKNKNKTFSEKREFYFLDLDDYNYSKDISCKGCKNDRVRGGQRVNISLKLKTDFNISGGELREYVPIEWNNISLENSSPENFGKIQKYNENYSVIKWNVSGKNITRNYSVISPGRKARPQEYDFRTVFGNKMINESEVEVRGRVSFLSEKKKNKNRKGSSGSSNGINHGEDFASGSSAEKEKETKKFNKLSVSNPAVIENKGKEENYKIAVFPKGKREEVSIMMTRYPPGKKMKGGIYYYTLESEIEERDIEKVFLNIEINKSELKEKDLKNLNLYLFKNNSWEKSDLNYSVEKEEIRYKGYEKSAKSFAIVENKSGKNENPKRVFSFFERLFNVLDKPPLPIKLEDIIK